MSLRDYLSRLNQIRITMTASHHTQLTHLNGQGQSRQAHTGMQLHLYRICTPVPFCSHAASQRLSSSILKQEGKELNETAVQRYLSLTAEQVFKVLGTWLGLRTVKTRDAEMTRKGRDVGSRWGERLLRRSLQSTSTQAHMRDRTAEVAGPPVWETSVWQMKWTFPYGNLLLYEDRKPSTQLDTHKLNCHPS